MNGQLRKQSSPRVGVLLVFAVIGLASLLVFIWGRRTAPQLPPVHLPELARTNLVNRAGVWYEIGQTNPFTGVLLEYYRDGGLMSRSVLSNGLLNGLSEGWYTNRQLQVRETYQTNYSDGVRTKWWPNGTTQSQATIALGKIQGLYRRWYSDGKLAEEIPMQAGQIEGTGHAYYESGFLKAEVSYHDGKIVTQHEWKDGEHRGNGAVNN